MNSASLAGLITLILGISISGAGIVLRNAEDDEKKAKSAQEKKP